MTAKDKQQVIFHEYLPSSRSQLTCELPSLHSRMYWREARKFLFSANTVDSQGSQDHQNKTMKAEKNHEKQRSGQNKPSHKFQFQ